MLPARGDYSDLEQNVDALLDGEICYAIDQDQYYQKEGTVLVAVGATKAQGLLADSALQDAPSNGYQYARQDGAWSIVTGGSGGGSSAYPETTFDLDADSTPNYLFSGAGFTVATANPDLVLIRGQKYSFNNTSGSHPFQIQTVDGLAYDDGVVDNNTVGLVQFTVPFNAPAELRYQCTTHPSTMVGTIAVLDSDLSSLVDVDFSVPPVNGEGLIYDSDSGKWKPKVPDPIEEETLIEAQYIAIAQDFEAYGSHSGEKNADNFQTNQTDAALLGEMADWRLQPIGMHGSKFMNHLPSTSVSPRPGFNGPWVGIGDQAVYIEFWFRHDAITASTSTDTQFIFGQGSATVAGDINNGRGGLVIEHVIDTSFENIVDPRFHPDTTDTSSYEQLMPLVDNQSALVLSDGLDTEGYYLVGTKGVEVADGFWHHIVFMQEPPADPQPGAAASGIYSCFVDGTLRDRWDANKNPMTVPIDTNNGDWDTYFLGALKDGTSPMEAAIDNFVVYGTTEKFPYPAGVETVEVYKGPVNVDRAFKNQTKGAPSRALGDFNEVEPLVGHAPVANAFGEYVPTPVLSVHAVSNVANTGSGTDNVPFPTDATDLTYPGEYSTGHYRYPLAVGTCLLDAANKTLFIWTGPPDDNTWTPAAGGWRKIPLLDI